MKTRKIVKITSLLSATILALGTTSSEAGFLKILKGEKEQQTCECEEYQRVAFVGGAVVKEVKGKAQVLSGVNKWSELKAGKIVSPGDMLRTGAGSRVILKMAESGSLVGVTPATIVRLVPLEKEWDRAALTGENEGMGYVVRALRGEAEFQTEDGWQKLTIESEVAPGSKIRLISGQQIDLHSREHGTVRLSTRGETVLPKAGQPLVRQLRTTPVVASSK